VITKILERGGHRTQVVEDGEQAVDLMLSGTFDLVLMDVNMPVLSGIEATKLYRFAALGRPRLPIIALTADATEEASARCMEAGMDAVLQKPIDRLELFRILGEIAADAEPTAHAAAEPPASDTVTELAAHPRFRSEVRAPIDTEKLTELEALGGRAFVAELASKFIEEGARIVAEIREAVAREDVLLFRDRLHALRSGAANIGALGLYESCLALREIDSAAFSAAGDEHARSIADEFRRVEVRLRGYEGGRAPTAGPPIRLQRQAPR
jgi:two-component system sensor histidine kinase RpfC